MKIFIGCLLLLTVLLVPINIVYAKPSEDKKVTICHVPTTPDETLSISGSALPAHLAHRDTLGACPPPPVIPEFGFIPGAIAAIASGGAFLLLKRRTSKS